MKGGREERNESTRKNGKTILIRASHVLTNRSTSQTSTRFTSESGWDRVFVASL